MSDIRLIDANAMYKRFCVEMKDFDWVYDSTDLPYMLGEMPTIYAIPIDWLEQRRFETSFHGAEPDIDLNYAFCTVMNEWQKEQEEQDGKFR